MIQSYLLFCIFLCFYSILQADRVESADGSVLFGKIIGVTDGNLTFETSYSSFVQIPLSEVVSLASSDNLSIRDENNLTSSGQSIPLPSGQLNLRGSKSSSAHSFSDIQHLWTTEGTDPWILEEQLFQESLQMKWENSFGFDLVGAAGNSDSLGMGLRLDSIYGNEYRELDLYLAYNAQKTNGLSETDETKAGAEYDSIFHDQLAWYLRADFEHDLIEQINLRATGAFGLKYDWITEDTYRISTRAGTALRYEDSMLPALSTETEPALDFGLEYSHEINELLSLESDLTLLPNASDLSDYLFSHDTALTIPIGEDPDWNLRSGLAGTYDSTPPQDFKKIDFKYYLRMVYSFQ